MPAPRFLCDRMLVRLGRWLRAAGYDTLIAEEGSADEDLIATARREKRLLLTRDRELGGHAPRTVRVLESQTLEEAAIELGRRAQVDWLARPFTRCLICNTRLLAAPRGALESVPEQSRALAGTVKRCPGCGRLYWEGSHVRRMRRRLRHWSEAQKLRR